MPTRLFTPRLEPKGKRVVIARTFRIFPNDLAKEQVKGELESIRKRIAIGLELEPRHYREGVDETVDGMLERTGINHLHLGNQRDDDLLYSALPCAI